MKTTLFTIALAVATMPLTFGQSPATPPASGSSAPAATTPKVKKHKKHVKPAANKNTTGSAASTSTATPAVKK